MKFGLVFPLTLLILHAAGQRLFHSRPETKEFDRFHFRVITRKNNRILIYKSVYLNSFTTYNERRTPPDHGNYGSSLNLKSGPTTAIVESSVAVYDTAMQLVSENILALPKEISGVSFIVYNDRFYLFYQCQRGHTLCCMAVAVGMDGQLRGDPVCLDSTQYLDIGYQSQIYAVVHSEDKEKIAVFKLNGLPDSGTVVSTALFDKQLHLIRRSVHEIGINGGKYLSEFQVDNKGNFVFVGLSHTLDRNKPENALLFTLPQGEDSRSYDPILSGEVYLDDVHILIDNVRGRYILSSFYSQEPEGHIEGFFTWIQDAARKDRPKTGTTVLSDSLRREVRDGGSLRAVFDTYFLQGMRLLADGGYAIETQQLQKLPDPGNYTRWNNLAYRDGQVGANFIFYDSYENDRRWPWNDWKQIDFIPRRFTQSRFVSDAGLIARFDNNGVVQWLNRIKIPQHDSRYNRLGYASLVADGRLYFIYNENIRGKRFLSGQCIDARGELNTDSRFRADGELIYQKEDYTYYPRLAQQVGSGELIIPCQKGRQVSLALLRL
jgi:hypothetical protein